MKRFQRVLLVAMALFALGAMGYVVFVRYSSSSLTSIVTLPSAELPTSETKSFVRSVDKDGNHLLTITGTIAAIEQRENIRAGRQETVLVLQVPENDATFELNLGPEIQKIFFRNTRLATTTQGENVTTAATYASTEVAAMLSVGETISVDLFLLKDLTPRVDMWASFFAGEAVIVSIHPGFILNIELHP